jgi:hypothetical protein
MVAEMHLRNLVGPALHDLPKMMVAALKMLPQTGPLRKNVDKNTVMSVSILLPNVPEGEPLRPQIAALYALACERAPKSAQIGEHLYRVASEPEQSCPSDGARPPMMADDAPHDEVWLAPREG